MLFTEFLLKKEVKIRSIEEVRHKVGVIELYLSDGSVKQMEEDEDWFPEPGGIILTIGDHFTFASPFFKENFLERIECL